MTLDTLRLVAQATRAQERYLNRKATAYEEFIEALERRGEGASVNDVYDEVISATGDN